MRAAAIYEVWAPPDGAWSAWAKPVAFTTLDDWLPSAEVPPPVLADPVSADAPWAPDAARRVAVIVDLPGIDALDAGLALARRGYRPVPLFNACHGPSAVLDMSGIVRRLAVSAPDLAAAAIPADAPPAFLLDARRDRPAPPPGMFDNRWIVLPQDFPSATVLASCGIGEVILVQRERSAPLQDLAHVLLRWQQAGIAVRSVDVARPGAAPEAIVVAPPQRFRSAFYALLALTGLRRSSAGGFGARVPVVPPAGSGGGIGFG